MIKSMTGYGRGEALLSGGKMTIEIRSLNGKNADINLKTSLIPKEKELDVRKRIADRLRRGTIDLYLTWEPDAEEAARPLNTDVIKSYYTQVLSLLTKKTTRSSLPSCACPMSWMPVPKRPTSSVRASGRWSKRPWTKPSRCWTHSVRPKAPSCTRT